MLCRSLLFVRCCVVRYCVARYCVVNYVACSVLVCSVLGGLVGVVLFCIMLFVRWFGIAYWVLFKARGPEHFVF